jgi:hypothetical protein
MTQERLFDTLNPEPDPAPIWTPVARASDPETSHQAAAAAAVRAGTDRALALRALARAGDRGLTDFELEAATRIKQTSIGKRRGELVKSGYVEFAGAKRMAPSGTPAMVWRVTERGLQVTAQREVA